MTTIVTCVTLLEWQQTSFAILAMFLISLVFIYNVTKVVFVWNRNSTIILLNSYSLIPLFVASKIASMEINFLSIMSCTVLSIETDFNGFEWKSFCCFNRNLCVASIEILFPCQLLVNNVCQLRQILPHSIFSHLLIISSSLSMNKNKRIND